MTSSIRQQDDPRGSGGADALDAGVPLENVRAGTRLYAEILKRHIPRRQLYLHPWGTQVYERKAQAAGSDNAQDGDAGEHQDEIVDTAASAKRPARRRKQGQDQDEAQEDKQPVYYFRPASPWGCARLTAIVEFPAQDAPAGERVCYEIAAHGVTAISSRKELHAGEWAERHRVPGVASRSSHAEWADIIEWQAELCGPVPVYQGRAGTGWGEVDGRHVHALPHGVWYGEDGPLASGTKAYMHLAAEHLAAYDDLDAETLAELHAHPDVQAQADALRFRASVAGRHLALLIDAALLDSAIYPLHRPDYSVLVRGPSGRGKTLVSGSGRNYLGRFRTCPPLPATGSFFDTSAAVERHATQLKHEPTTIDDLVIRKEDGAATKAEKARTVRAILHSVGNNTPVRRRMSHSMQEQPSYKFETVPVLTSEELLPDMAESDLNRAVVLRFDELGIVDLERLKGDGPGHEAGMLGAGLGYLAHIARRWNAEGETYADELRRRHVTYTAQIHADMLARRNGQALPSEADRLPSNGAHLLLALSAMQDYCTAAGVPYTVELDAIRADLVAELVAQVDLIQALMTGSHNGVTFDAWVGGVLRRLADEGQRHITTPDGELPDPRQLPIYPVRLGWRERGYAYDAKTEERRPDLRPNGALLAVTSRRCHYLCAEKHTLFDILSVAAAKDGRPFPATADEMLREFDRFHMIARDTDGRCLDRKVRMGNARPRLVWIARHIVWPELQKLPPSTINPVGPVGPVGPFSPSPELVPGEPSQSGPTDDQNGPTDDQNGPTKGEGVGPFATTSSQTTSGAIATGPTGPTGPTPHVVHSDLPCDDIGWPDESTAPSATLDTWDYTPAPAPLSDRAREITERALRAGADAWDADRRGHGSMEGDELI